MMFAAYVIDRNDQNSIMYAEYVTERKGLIIIQSEDTFCSGFIPLFFHRLLQNFYS